MSNFNECANCIDIGDISCRSRRDDRISYCCDAAGEWADECTAFDADSALNYDVCSHEVITPTMKYFSCPFQEDFCGNNNHSMAILAPGEGFNHTSFSASGRQFRNNQQCYYQVMAFPETMTNYSNDYFIDVNMTVMNGVWGMIHNGTLANFATNATEIEFDYQRNYTFNASDYQSIFLTFIAQPNFQGSTFLADVYLREEEKTSDDEEDEVSVDYEPPGDLPKFVYFTWNEIIIMSCFMLGLCCYCCCMRHCAGRLTPSFEKKRYKDTRIGKGTRTHSMPDFTVYSDDEDTDKLYATRKMNKVEDHIEEAYQGSLNFNQTDNSKQNEMEFDEPDQIHDLAAIIDCVGSTNSKNRIQPIEIDSSRQKKENADFQELKGKKTNLELDNSNFNTLDVMKEAGIGRNASLAGLNSSPALKQVNSTMNKDDKANRLLSLTGLDPQAETRPRQDTQSEGALSVAGELEQELKHLSEPGQSAREVLSQKTIDAKGKTQGQFKAQQAQLTDTQKKKLEL